MRGSFFPSRWVKGWSFLSFFLSFFLSPYQTKEHRVDLILFWFESRESIRVVSFRSLDTGEKNPSFFKMFFLLLPSRISAHITSGNISIWLDLALVRKKTTRAFLFLGSIDQAGTVFDASRPQALCKIEHTFFSSIRVPILDEILLETWSLFKSISSASKNYSILTSILDSKPLGVEKRGHKDSRYWNAISDLYHKL